MRAGPALSAALAAALVGAPALHAQAEPTCPDGWSLRSASEGGRYCMVAGVSPGYAPGSWLGAGSWLPADCDDLGQRCSFQTRVIPDERFHGGVPVQLTTTASWLDIAGGASIFRIPDSGVGGALFEAGICSVVEWGTPTSPPPLLENPGDSALVNQLRLDCGVYWGDPQCPEGAWNAEQDACGPGVPEDPPPPLQQIQGSLTVNGAKTATLEPGQVGSFELAVRGATDARIVCEGIEKHAQAGLPPEDWTRAAPPLSFPAPGTYRCTLQGHRSRGPPLGQYVLAQAAGTAPPGTPLAPPRAASDWTDLDSVEVTVAAAPTFTACDGSPHDTQEAADAVTCFTACDGSLHHTQQAADAVTCFTACDGSLHHTQQAADAVLCPPELEFAAGPAEIAEGESSTLAWSCQRCGMLTVDLVNRNPRRPGSETVTPPFTMVYPATAWGEGSSASTRVDKSVRVVVNPVGPRHVGCDGKVYETAAEAAATCVFTDCLGRTHPSQEEAEAVECFEDCLLGIHLSQGAALAVPCPFTDCAGGGHGTQAEADAIACFTDCAGRRIHLPGCGGRGAVLPRRRRTRCRASPTAPAGRSTSRARRPPPTTATATAPRTRRRPRPTPSSAALTQPATAASTTRKSWLTPSSARPPATTASRPRSMTAGAGATRRAWTRRTARRPIPGRPTPWRWRCPSATSSGTSCTTRGPAGR